MKSEYEPFPFRRYSRVQDVAAAWGDGLASMKGRRLTQAFAQWRTAELGPQGWWVDGPVILRFEDIQLELGATCCEFSVSIDVYDFNVDAVTGDDEVGWVNWRSFPWPELEPFRDRPLDSLKAVLSCWGGEQRFKGLSFGFNEGAFCFFDAGDQLGLTWSSLPDDPSLAWTLGRDF